MDKAESILSHHKGPQTKENNQRVFPGSTNNNKKKKECDPVGNGDFGINHREGIHTVVERTTRPNRAMRSRDLIPYKHKVLRRRGRIQPRHDNAHTRTTQDTFPNHKIPSLFDTMTLDEVASSQTQGERMMERLIKLSMIIAYRVGRERESDQALMNAV